MKPLDLSRIGAVHIAYGYTKIRWEINGLAAQAQQKFRLDPRLQAVFLFCGKKERPVQGTVLGRRRICVVVQTSGEWVISMVAHPRESAAANPAAVSLAL